ncbi:MAG: hypothetical protein J0H85_16125 [Sediminibacterium magnilacihabitans]|jgi:hypothetical protein|nr:hypothetical protein [Sediminibacterium magnilacihabitans]PQV58054.1 hypothetical protein CLV53_12441 [Sediminibacterium magnilacihabitans]
MNDTSISHSTQPDAAIPQSKIASLSSEEFVGPVTDDPDTPIALKGFHAKIINDHEMLKKEQNGYKPLPTIRNVTAQLVQKNHLQVKEDIQSLIEHEMNRFLNDPLLTSLIVKKENTDQ